MIKIRLWESELLRPFLRFSAETTNAPNLSPLLLDLSNIYIVTIVVNKLLFSYHKIIELFNFIFFYWNLNYDFLYWG